MAQATPLVASDRAAVRPRPLGLARGVGLALCLSLTVSVGRAQEEGGPAVSREVASPEPTAAAPDEAAAGQARELEALQQEYTSLMDELVALRSRTAVLAGQLFETRLKIIVENDTDDDQVLERLRLLLDGAPVFQVSEGDFAERREVFEGALAPGFHVFGVELSQRSRSNRDFRYTLRDDYRFELRPGTETELRLLIEDNSDIADAYEDRGSTEADGEYEVHIEVQVEQAEVKRAAGQEG